MTKIKCGGSVITLNLIFAWLLLLLKAINKEEVVSTVVIGVGNQAELRDSLEVQVSGMSIVKISIK